MNLRVKRAPLENSHLLATASDRFLGGDLLYGKKALNGLPDEMHTILSSYAPSIGVPNPLTASVFRIVLLAAIRNL